MIELQRHPSWRNRRETALPRVWFVVLATLLSAAGCANERHALNAADVPLEARRMNATRAAAFASVVPVGLADALNIRSHPEILTPPPSRADVGRPGDADGCFVGLALSGGGSRSANFAAACMFQLQRVGLLQRVDYVSAVSGGTLPAAYYCSHGPEWNPGNVQDRLSHGFASEAILDSLLPWNLFGLMFTPLNRTDLLAATFQRTLFSTGGRAMTYGDLRDDRPRLLLNATDLQSGRRFVFCNESFDELNYDLASYPLAYAVAASSAVPVATHPVTLRDYSTTFRQYRYLIDGGIADNLGVETLVEVYAAHLGAARARGAPDPYPRGAVFIVCDARTQFDAKFAEGSEIGIVEGLKAAIGLTSSALLNRASAATLSDIIVRNSPDGATAGQLRAQIDELNANGYLALTDKRGHPVRVVYLSLGQVNDLAGLPFQSFRESVNSIATYFNISATEAYNLFRAADLLVREKFEERLDALARELNGPMAPPTRPTTTTLPDSGGGATRAR